MPGGPAASLDASSALAAGHFGPLQVWSSRGAADRADPCVYPLIPITVSVFSGGRVAARSSVAAGSFDRDLCSGHRRFFSVIGVLVARAGVAFGSWLAYPAVQAAMAIFFIAMAASMFGAFELALPHSLALRLERGGRYRLCGAFPMGLVAGPVAAPCTGPVLAGILLYVGQQHSVALGAGLLFLYALGIGVPFFLIGVSAFLWGRAVPGWMRSRASSESLSSRWPRAICATPFRRSRIRSPEMRG